MYMCVCKLVYDKLFNSSSRYTYKTGLWLSIVAVTTVHVYILSTFMKVCKSNGDLAIHRSFVLLVLKLKTLKVVTNYTIYLVPYFISTMLYFLLVRIMGTQKI